MAAETGRGDGPRRRAAKTGREDGPRRRRGFRFPPEIVFNHPNEKKKDDCGKWDKTFDEACCEGQEFSKHGCNDGCKQNSVDYYVCFLNTLAKDEGSKCTFDASDCTKDSCEKAKKKNKKSDSAASLAVGTAAALAATAAFVAL